MRRACSNEQGGGGKRLKVVSNDTKELGKIESISLQNFMCHDNFSFQFGQRMNFIIGQNGSGKSAILTGLILAMGGKSRATGRYSNIKGFIKTGKQKAKLEVVLFNTSEYAYKPEIYGEKIHIVREFTVDGSNSYKLKSNKGKVISSQKEELLNVLNAMDIQIENPVQIFTQETSRSFLLSKHATDENLYDMFLKGTGLHRLEKSYLECKTLKKDGQLELEKKKQALEAMKDDMKKWSRFLESSKRVANYKNELLWAGTIAMEKKLEEKKNEYKKVENHLNINKREIEKCKVAIDAKEKQLAEYSKNRGERNTQLSEYRSKLQKINAEKENCTLALRKYKGSLDLHKKEERKIINEIENLQIRIRENKQKNQIDVREDEKRRQEEIGKLQETNKQIVFELDKLKEQMSSQMEAQGQLKQQIDNLVAEINNTGYHKKKTEENINRAKMALKNKVNVFGDYTQRVLNDIAARASEFRKLPKGPIGMYLEVKDPNWIPAVEKCIGRNLLCSYCVDNHQDDRLLKEILRKHCTNKMLPSTIVCSYSNAVYDVSQYKAQTNHPTVLDMLSIQDVQVANALIDHVKIECKILLEDTNIGQNLMMSNPPRNCISAFIKNCDQICLSPYRYYSEANPRNNSLLSSMRQNEINQLGENLNRLKIELQTKEEEKIRLQKKYETIPNAEKKLSSHIVRLSTMYKENQDKLKDLECVKEPEDVFCLEEDLQGLKQDLENKQIEISNCERKVAQYSTDLAKIEDESRTQRKLLCDEKEEFDELGVRIQNCSQEKEVLTSGKDKFEKEAKNCERQLQLMQAELQDHEKKTQDATQRATKICPRIDTKRDIQEIERQLAETLKVVEKSSHCNRDELLKKYNEKEKTIADAEIELKKRSHYMARIEDILKFRQHVFKEMGRFTRQVVNMVFGRILGGNGFTGCCVFDVNNRTLQLKVNPKSGQTLRRNHSILSGGERSYVTLAFLMALWEKSDMPFRILDEYDVFMDSNNRQLSVDLLVSKAKAMGKTQFIFLSPLDLPDVDWPKDCVKIHKMIPPKRKDGAGPSSEP